MQSSKKLLIKRIVALVLLIAMVAVPCKVLGYILTPVAYADYFNHDVELLKAENAQVDMIILGASRVYRCLSPQILEETLDDSLEIDRVLCGASAAQPYVGSYYELKELIKTFHPKYAVLEVNWDKLVKVASRHGKTLVYDRLTGLNKLDFALNCFEGKTIKNALYVYRYRENLGEIKSFYQKRKELIESDYAPTVKGGEYYAGNGFIYSEDTVKQGNMKLNGSGTFDESAIIAENLSYLDKCVELCQQEGIKLTLVSCPTSMMRLYYMDNYQGMDDYYRHYADEKGLTYLNLNYLKDREAMLPDTKMCDYNHTNGAGAETISPVFAEIYSKVLAGEPTDDYFYGNLDELKASVDRVVAVKADMTVDGDQLKVKATSYHNDDVTPCYQLLVAEDDGDFEVVVDWTEKDEFALDIPETDNYKVKIRGSLDKGNDDMAYQIYAKILAVYADYQIDGEGLHLDVSSLHSQKVTPYYQVSVSKDDENYDVMVDWTTDSSLDVTFEEEGDYYLKIDATHNPEKESSASQTYLIHR